MIYVITCTETKTCKIGYSTSPDSRLKQLQTSNAHTLHLAKTIPGEIEDEKELHRRFKHLSKKGEWFELTSEIEDYFKFQFIENDTLIDSKALTYFKKHLNRSEMGSVLIMIEYLKTPLNIIYNGSHPHTNESLQKTLEIASSSTFNLLIKKLTKLNIISKSKSLVNGKVRLIYIMNPFFAKKSTSIDENLFQVFKKFNLHQ